jgi:hypothetical protein
MSGEEGVSNLKSSIESCCLPARTERYIKLYRAKPGSTEKYQIKGDFSAADK